VIKHPLKATSKGQNDRHFRLHPYGYPKDGRTLLLAKDVKVFKWRLYGSVCRAGTEEVHPFVPSPDLAAMLVLLIADLVPAGVAADRWQEECPTAEPACNFLREWEECKLYSPAIDKIMKKGME